MITNLSLLDHIVESKCLILKRSRNFTTLKISVQVIYYLFSRTNLLFCSLLGQVDYIKVSRNDQRLFSGSRDLICVTDLKPQQELPSHRYTYFGNNNSFINNIILFLVEDAVMTLNSDLFVNAGQSDGFFNVYDLSTKKRIHQFRTKHEKNGFSN